MNVWKPVALVAMAGMVASLGIQIAHADVVCKNQPNMQSALDHLRQARASLDKAEHNKGGWRDRAITATDETAPDSLRGKILELAVDRLTEDLHQRADLTGVAAPVLGRKGVQGQELNSKIETPFDTAPNGLCAFQVSTAPGPSSLFGPPSIAIHDNRNMSGNSRGHSRYPTPEAFGPGFGPPPPKPILLR